MNRSTSTVKRKLSRWTVGLLTLSLPLVAYLFIYLTEDPKTKPTPPTLDRLLEDAQIVGGVNWKFRSVLFRILPGNARDAIKLKNPGDRFQRQISALDRFAQFPGEADRKIPVLSNIVRQTTNKMVLSIACEALSKLGTNALHTLPLILDLAEMKSGLEELDLLIAATMIGPDRPEVQLLVTNRLARVIATHSLPRVPPQPYSIPSSDGITLIVLIHTLPQLEIDDAQIETLFSTAYASNNPDVITRMFQPLRFTVSGDSRYTAGLVKSLVVSWDQQCEQALKSPSTASIISAALNHEQTHHLANRIFREQLKNEFVTAQQVMISYDSFVDAKRTTPLQHATDDTVFWLVTSPQDYLWDGGVWIEKLQRKNAIPDTRLKSWLIERVLANENPNQVNDWGRYLANYGEVEQTLKAAADILKTGQIKKQESLAARLARRNPSAEHKLDRTFIERYGLHGSSGPTIDDVIQTLIDPLSYELKCRLLNELIAEVEHLPPGVQSRDGALKHLNLLEKTFKAEGANVE